MAISEFKARCLAVLESVRRTGEPVLVTRRGVPVAEVVPPSGTGDAPRVLGVAVGSGRIVGDIEAPAADPRDWELLQE